MVRMDSHLGRIGATLVLGLLLGAVGCEGKPSQACHQRMAEAQQVVGAVDQESQASIEQSLSAIETAKRVCAEAGRESETVQLNAAEERFQSHLVRLKEREAKRAERSAIRPERLAELTRNGDPDCPKGQGYLHKASGKEIRCTGVLPIEMDATKATKYFAGRGFSPMKNAGQGEVAMELGAERVVLHYPPGSEAVAPTCLVYYPKPGISWQESVARMTGTPPERLKVGHSIKSSRGELRLQVDEKNVVVRLGDCP